MVLTNGVRLGGRRVDEDVPIQVALGTVIRARRVQEFAVKVKMAPPNVLRAINPRHNLVEAAGKPS